MKSSEFGMNLGAELDSNAIQSALAQAISGLGAEVVYCGKTAADTGAGSTESVLLKD